MSDDYFDLYQAAKRRVFDLEAQNQQLREALLHQHLREVLLRFVSVATDAMPWNEHLDKAVEVGRAALAATEKP